MHLLTRPLLVPVLAGLLAVPAVSPGLHAAEPATRPPSPPSLRDCTDAAMRGDGSAARGREVFLNETKGGCARCHSIDGTAGRVGPDLYAVGDRFPRRELIRAVLEPSASIAIGYGTTLITKNDGEELAGIVKQVTTAGTELMLGDGRLVRVPAAEVREQRGSTVSLMPEGLHATLSKGEFTDLIEFLASLKQPASALSSHRGLPLEIAELNPPAVLRPLFAEDLRFPHAFVHKPGDVRSGVVWFGALPGGSNEFLVVHQTGRIWQLNKGAGGDTKTLFGDFSAELFNERGPNGLLGMAFHPQFTTNRRYFLKHQVFEDGHIATLVVEKLAAPDGRHDSGQRSRRLLTMVSTTQDHSGGCLGFGPDGFLYVAMGDTGPQQDPQGHGQDPGTLLGKILRVDIDHTAEGLPYAIPADNPFRGRPGFRPEIWALGFREPWRFSFDPVTRDLWVGDVGQDRVEEVGIVRRGENHGWNVFEGFEPFSNRYRQTNATYTPPVFAYRRKYGNSVTGGLVYRGDPRSSFYGVYICADYTSRRIWALTQRDRVLQTIRQIAVAPQGIVSFASDERGEIYVVGYEGMIYRLDLTGTQFPRDPAGAPGDGSLPSATGRLGSAGSNAP